MRQSEREVIEEVIKSLKETAGYLRYRSEEYGSVFHYI